jgi:ABC-type branched-subunit amino acid transport system permease subunit
LALVPQLIGTRLPSYSDGLVFVLLFASLALLVRTSGQVSLCHMAFAAVGAATFSHLVTDGVPWLVSMLVAGLVAVPIGAVLAIPAIRLSRLYLALATFGFGILLERFVFNTSFMFGQAGQLTVKRPGFAHGDHAYYYLILASVLVSLAVLYTVNHSRLGRLLQAMSDSPTALSTFGINVSVTRVIVFCIASFFAGICGALLAGLTESASTTSFDYFESLLLLPVLYLAGRSELVSPFVAAFALAVAPSYFTGQWFSTYQPIIFGVAAVGAAISSSGRYDALGRLAGMASERVKLIRKGPIASRLPSRPALAGTAQEIR